MRAKIEAWGKWKIIWLRSDDLDGCIQYYQDNKLDGFGISQYEGFEDQRLEFLKKFPRLEALVIPYANKFDISPLQSLKQLRFLSLSGSTQELDLGIFPRLEEIRIECHRKLTLPPPQSSSLTAIYLRCYKPAIHDLEELSSYAKLRRIELVQSSIRSLAGGERLRLLQHAEFSYLPKLEIIAQVARTPVELLHFEVCRSIRDPESLATAPQLKILRYLNCGKLESIKFIAKIKTLEEFRFVKTKILDGDLSPLLRLKAVGFLPAKWYSHTPKQIEELIPSRD